MPDNTGIAEQVHVRPKPRFNIVAAGADAYEETLERNRAMKAIAKVGEQEADFHFQPGKPKPFDW